MRQANRTNPEKRASFPWRAVLATAARAGLVAALLVIAVVGYYRARDFLYRDARFHLGTKKLNGRAVPAIAIHGRQFAPAETIYDVFAQDIERSVLAIPIEQRRQQLLGVPWIRDATVIRVLPNRLKVVIKERQPVAFVLLPHGQDLQQVALIDREGVILPVPPRADFDLPVLIGVSSATTREQRARQVEAAMKFLEEAGERAQLVSEIDVTDPENLRAVLMLDGKLVRVVLGEGNYRSRLERFLRYLPEIRAQYPAATTFDLRLDDRVTIWDGTKRG